MLQTQQLLHDRYRLLDLLGKNAGRQTWLAQDQTTQATVVVKLLTFSDQVEWQQLRLFEREAKVLRQLDHPQIPQYRDFFSLDDRLLWFCLVQSYIPGRSLKQILSDGIAFTEDEARDIARQILRILIYLHGLIPPVLHRDIKPSNLVRGKDGTVYLVDFGAVQDKAAREGATFTVVGTYGYAPLEQLGGRATPASDLYALGTTLVHLLTGVPPSDLPQKDGRLQFARLLALNPGFVRWLSRLVEPNARDRFATAQEALDALQANEAAIVTSTRSMHPANSRIRLEKSPTQLTVTIPTESIAVTDLLVAGCVAFYVWVFLTLSLSPLVNLGSLAFVLLLLAWWGLPRFRKTVISLDSQRFVIAWTVLGLRGRRWEGAVTDIDRVSRGEIQGRSQVFHGVSFTVGVRELIATSFSPEMTTAERDWLVHEINQWLGMATNVKPQPLPPEETAWQDNKIGDWDEYKGPPRY